MIKQNAYLIKWFLWAFMVLLFMACDKPSSSEEKTNMRDNHPTGNNHFDSAKDAETETKPCRNPITITKIEGTHVWFSLLNDTDQKMSFGVWALANGDIVIIAPEFEILQDGSWRELDFKYCGTGMKNIEIQPHKTGDFKITLSAFLKTVRLPVTFRFSILPVNGSRITSKPIHLAPNGVWHEGGIN